MEASRRSLARSAAESLNSVALASHSFLGARVVGKQTFGAREGLSSTSDLTGELASADICHLTRLKFVVKTMMTEKVLALPTRPAET